MLSQVQRERVATQIRENPYCVFYYNSRQSIEKFVNTTWLDFLDNAEMTILMDAFLSTFAGLRADVAAVLDVSVLSGAAISQRHFANFVKRLLQTLFPTLRSRFLKSVVDDNGYRAIFIWGDKRDKSSFLPRMSAILSWPSIDRITFLANAAWVDSRAIDLQLLLASGGSGNLAIGMSRHPRLGRDSPLNQLNVDVLRMIVNLID